jgi:hypothetical protein
MAKPESKRWDKNSTAGLLLKKLFDRNIIAPGTAASKIRQKHIAVFGEYSSAVFRNAYNRFKARSGTMLKNAKIENKKGTIKG